MKTFYFHLFCQSLRDRPSQSEQGLTLVELLLSMLISGILLGLAFFTFSSIRQMYFDDEARSEVNKAFQTAFNFMGTDIRQAGEYIDEDDFPAVLNIVVDSNSNSEITIYRHLFGTILDVCQDIKAGESGSIFVVHEEATSGCRVGLNDGAKDDGWLDNLATWWEYRQSNDGSVRAFIFDGGNQGEFFNYIDEDNFKLDGTSLPEDPPDPPGDSDPDNPVARYSAVRTTSDKQWQNDYSGTNAQMYILDERQYRLQGDSLQVVENNSVVTNLVSGIEKMEISARVEQPDPNDPEKSYFFNCTTININPTDPTNANNFDCVKEGTQNFDPNLYEWNQIREVQVTLTAEKCKFGREDGSGNCDDGETETITGRFVPRNVFNF